MTICSNLSPFLDGELAPSDAAAFRDHLPDCAFCDALLIDHIQIMARLSELSRCPGGGVSGDAVTEAPTASKESEK